MNGKDTALFSKASDEWSTPQWLFDKLNEEFLFECDAAATEWNGKCGEEWLQNALEDPWMKWGHKRFWLNPPYSKIAAFMKKAYEESLKGATVVCLIPSRTDTQYWHNYVMKAAEIRFVKGRLKFGNEKNSAPFPSVVVVFDPVWSKDSARFVDPSRFKPIIGITIEQPKKVPR
jgi:site-specific DNA-methyltransferase (adenine-specific)